MKYFKKIKIQDGGRPPCWKISEMPWIAYQWTDLGETWVVAWHHVPICRPWCGCHGNDRCLATARWTFSSYGRLESGSLNQFWWNLVHNSRFGSRWQSHAQILKFLTLKIEDDRHIGKCWKCSNLPTSEPISTKLEWSHPIMSPTCPVWCGCHGNCLYLATALWTFSSYWRLEVERINHCGTKNEIW